jgi:pilus assembly protein CpaC
MQTFGKSGWGKAVLVAAMTWCEPLWSQLPATEPRPELPVIPQQAARAAEGAAPAEQWKLLRTPPDDAPVASFIDSLKGNDAAFEVVLGQGRLLTTKKPIASKQGGGVVAVGNPSIIDFEIMPNPQMIRVMGKRPGTTDLSITTADGQTYSLEVRVVYDFELLRARLVQAFPDARLRFGQLKDHVIVEGQARSPQQVAQILSTIDAYLTSFTTAQISGAERTTTFQTNPPPVADDRQAPRPAPADQAAPNQPSPAPAGGYPQAVDVAPAGPGGPPQVVVQPQIINLIQIPGMQQVLLKVKIAELNRTALRQVGADLFGFNPNTGNFFGTNISGATAAALATLGIGGIGGGTAAPLTPATTAFGVFPSGDFAILLRILRRNSLLNILAEPNLMAMSGHRASFLAGGQFPVPVPQGAGGVTNNVTIQFKDFGVQLDFVPYVMDDDRIRLSVTPEVSSIDPTLSTTLVNGGTPVPGLTTRRATTTVELRQFQTLAIAGLLQVTIDAQTQRIPGLGDLPYIGPLFSNTTHSRAEKELVVLVTPELVQPLECDEVPPLPGSTVQDPNNLEFYLMNRIEGRTGQNFRSTTDFDDPKRVRLERQYMHGPVGYSD